MGVFKQFNAQDIIVSPLEVSKAYTASIVPIFSSSGGYSYISYGTGLYSESLDRVDAYGFQNGIERYVGKNDIFNKNGISSGIYSKFKNPSIYNSIKQLYYSNFISGSLDADGNYIEGDANSPEFRPDGVVTGSSYNTIFDNFRQTDLLEDKYFPTASDAQIAVLSIPTDLYGDILKPGSFSFTFGPYSGSVGATITDDGEGRLYSGSTVVGNVIYTHGIAVITTPPGGAGGRVGYGFQDFGTEPFGARTASADFFEGFLSGSDLQVGFSSSYTLYETQYKCTIEESEFNYSQNGTVFTCKRGIPYDFITGSYFSPYVTTVGLYNDAYELLAVAKLAKPLPTSKFSDTTILVNFDRQ